MTVTRSSLLRKFLYAYALLSPLGNFARLSQNEGSYGITTILLVFIALVAFPFAFKVILRQPTLRAFGFLILWVFLASALALDPLNAFGNSASLFIYLLASSAAFCSLFDDDHIVKLLTAFALGGCLGAIATLVDFTGLIDLPGINENIAATRTEVGYIMQVSGPFARRSAMAAYYTMIISIGILLPIYNNRLKLSAKFFFLFSSMVCSVSLALTHNRAGILSAAMAVLVCLIFSSSNLIFLIQKLCVLVFLGMLFLAALNTLFPDAMLVYQSFLEPSEAYATIGFLQLSESDALRITFFQHTMSSLLENPIGHGYSLLTGVSGYEDFPVDPHGNLTQIVWASGLFGVLWLLLFGSRAVVQSLRLIRTKLTLEPISRLIPTLIGALLSFLILGVSHTVISTGIAWILCGSLLRLIKEKKLSSLQN